MTCTLCLCVLGFLASTILLNSEALKMLKKEKKIHRLKSIGSPEILGKPYQKPDGSIEFPSSIEYTINMGGEGNRTLSLEVNPFLDIPSERKMKRKTFAFYLEKNTGESMACMVEYQNGKVNCKVAGIIEKGGETCFISTSSNMADCVSSEGFTDEVLLALDKNGEIVSGTMPSPQQENVEKRAKSRTPFRRRKRSAGFPDPGFKAVEVAFVVDEAFMLPFYARNPGDNAAAEMEAEIFVTLLANEMSIYYSSVKMASGGSLDLVLYPVEFIHPGNGNNFPWSENNIIPPYALDGLAALSQFRFFAYNNIAVQYDHAMALSGLDLWAGNNGLLGVAYINTVCTNADLYKVSLQEYFTHNLGWIASHELGHALGAGHDGDAGSSGCSPGTNVMSPYVFNPTPSTQHTYYKFSSCSVEEFTNHLNSLPDCLIDNGFTDEQFQEKFCAGLLGEQSMSLDRQCQIRTRSSTATSCSTTVPPTACYQGYQVYCRTSEQGSCSFSLTFVWNGSPCGNGMFCYKSSCTTQFDICQNATTTTTTPVTTTTTPVTTTTTPVTTTTTPVTTTTTPVTTTTTPVTTTTTPVTTTTTPVTTTTTPVTTTTTPMTTTTTPVTTTTTPVTTTTTPVTTTTTPVTTTTTPVTTTTTPVTTTTTPVTTTTTPVTTTTTPVTTTTTPVTTTTTPVTTTTTPVTTTTTPVTTTTTPVTTTTTPVTTTMTPVTTTTTQVTTTTTPVTTTTTPVTTTTTPVTTTTTTTTPVTTTTTPVSTTTTPVSTTTTPVTTTTTPVTTTTTTTPATTTTETTTTTPVTTTTETTTTTPVTTTTATTTPVTTTTTTTMTTTTTPNRFCKRCCRSIFIKKICCSIFTTCSCCFTFDRKTDIKIDSPRDVFRW